MDSYVSKPLRADDFYAAVEGQLTGGMSAHGQAGKA